MRTRLVAAAGAAALLAGCPIPQPLPDYPAGTVTPPRILVGTLTRSGESLTPVPSGCLTSPQFDLAGQIFYQENVTVEARWFVDYRKDEPSRYVVQNTIREVPADPNPLVLLRSVPPFSFKPYSYPPPAEVVPVPPANSSPGVVHVVELVVSNGFDPDPSAAEPNRTPAILPGGSGRFEIQNFRWVFVNVAGLPCP